MQIKRILYIEDNTLKLMSVMKFLRSMDIPQIDTAGNAEKAVKMIVQAHHENRDYDLIVSDMHFDFYGKDDIEAGEKTMKLIREKGIDTPIIFCSSQNWKIPGAVGNIFYNERRDWETEARALFQELFAM